MQMHSSAYVHIKNSKHWQPCHWTNKNNTNTLSKSPKATSHCQEWVGVALEGPLLYTTYASWKLQPLDQSRDADDADDNDADLYCTSWQKILSSVCADHLAVLNIGLW